MICKKQITQDSELVFECIFEICDITSLIDKLDISSLVFTDSLQKGLTVGDDPTEGSSIFNYVKIGYKTISNTFYLPLNNTDTEQLYIAELYRNFKDPDIREVDIDILETGLSKLKEVPSPILLKFTITTKIYDIKAFFNAGYNPNGTSYLNNTGELTAYNNIGAAVSKTAKVFLDPTKIEPTTTDNIFYLYINTDSSNLIGQQNLIC